MIEGNIGFPETRKVQTRIASRPTMQLSPNLFGWCRQQLAVGTATVSIRRSRSTRPDFWIGTDPFHSPEHLGDWLVSAIQKLGFSAALNSPFSGALVPTKHYQREENVIALMIEVNRGLYMDERSGKRSERFDGIKQVLSGILRALKERID